ncbi:hypothetical protein [Cytobacillus purgationiresistens]|uniref:YodL-like protein n=1 Tax=Cytobacillus purgationiresistens TaxID=863449 RepID=A0ABU0AT23_9BACI|nr:hypothetical protein [Cytobacillus purgationiresistens]MDQ0273922.1 hypothetical protein [Cytobacillus purgationiresistens]
MLKELTKSRKKEFDVTIFQTPVYRESKGYRQVYRLFIEGMNHEDCLTSVFKKFNVPDRMPCDFAGRFITTGDILYIDEGKRGQHYYQLKSGGWMKINRIHIR